MFQPVLRIPYFFDVHELHHDLTTCLGHVWPQHFNQSDYEGEWTSIALRSASGDAHDISSHSDAEYRDTPLLEKCKYFRMLLTQFHCPLESVRLLRLSPGSVIREHRDLGTSYGDGVFRIHVAITTNDQVKFIVGGYLVRMLPGECWYADFSLPHSVRNDGDSSRVHLVIDALRNEWTDELFHRAGYDFEAEKKKNTLSKETKHRMIEELARQASPAAMELLLKLRREDAGDF